MRVFDKSKYAVGPRDDIRKAIEKLNALGPAVVAVRGASFSANLLGTVYIGDDNGDPVLRVESCSCHIHVMWNKIHGFVLAEEDVGFGPEPVVYLVDKDQQPVINLFYPKKILAEVQALLS